MALVRCQAFGLSGKQSDRRGPQRGRSRTISNNFPGLGHDFDHLGSDLGVVIQPAPERTELLGFISVLARFHQACKKGVQRGLATGSQFQDFIDKHAVLKGGLGEKVKVRLGRTEHSCPNIGVPRVSNRHLGKRMTGFGALRFSPRAGGLEADCSMRVIGEQDGCLEEFRFAVPS